MGCFFILLFSLITLLPLGLAGFLLLQVLAGWRTRLPTIQPGISAGRPSVAILMPAHNEELGIARGVEHALPELAEGDKLLVIADNCDDGTADVARRLGAEVIERDDLTHRGKGYALDFGIQHLRHNPPDVLMVVDADCVLTPGSVDAIARASVASGCPQQALNLMVQPEGVTALKPRIAEFAWLFKNQVRPLGSKALGLPCQLMGTGMGFPWEVLSRVNIASSNIVEDMKLGVDLARLGSPVVFCPSAKVVSEFPSDAAAATAQRTRWEHGHMGTILGEVPSMLGAAWRDRDWRSAGLAVDLAVPPVALFVMLQVAWFLLMVLFHEITGEKEPGALALLALCFTAAALLGAWWRWARHLIAAKELMLLPLYALVKIPLYIAFWTKRQTVWVRAKRG